MGRYYWYFIAFLILLVSVYGYNFNGIFVFNAGNNNIVSCQASTVDRAFRDSQLVPDLIPISPNCLARVHFPSGAEALLGNHLITTQVADSPTVTWNYNPNYFYTVTLGDPDVPARAAPVLKDFNHWLVVNIRGGDITSGETLAVYIGPTPPPLTDTHRYAILVYQQPGRLDFDEIPLLTSSTAGRYLFSITNFAEKYNLGNPIAGNFFRSRFDSIISTLQIIKL